MPAGEADVAGVGGVQVHEAVRRHSVDEEAAPPARRRWRRVTIAAGRLYLAEGRKMSDGMEEFGDAMVRRKGVIWLVMLMPCSGERATHSEFGTTGKAPKLIWRAGRL
jgi:hypothetical protein